MKVESSINTFIVYIFDNKYFNKNIKEIIKKILLALNKYYDLEFKNSYNLKLYINKYYGMILEIVENNYNQYSDNIIDINLKVFNDSLFLYEVDDPLDYLDNEIYYYDYKFFANIKKVNISILEYTNIIYGEEVYKIIGKGIKL